ncbi:hypothetical protein SBA3_4370005 [Candidatus Sulfopaludibacter sp. SbA3]|nr:hypothetical protein SBA3_4370005 [Candidatus Sulfopaludibacter sp. SbA3]
MRREKLLTFETPLFRYKEFDRRDAFLRAVLEKIRAIPGVIDAGATSRLLLTPNEAAATFYWISGQPRERIRDQVAIIRLVTRDYLPTIGARLREGRFFETLDRHSDAQVAIVNETFANRNFPGRSAIGAQFKFGRTGDKGYWYRIVGVVKEIHEVGMEEVSRTASRLQPARARQRPAYDSSGRDRGSDRSRAGVDCVGSPASHLVHR